MQHGIQGAIDFDGQSTVKIRISSGNRFKTRVIIILGCQLPWIQSRRNRVVSAIKFMALQAVESSAPMTALIRRRCAVVPQKDGALPAAAAAVPFLFSASARTMQFLRTPIFVFDIRNIMSVQERVLTEPGKTPTQFPLLSCFASLYVLHQLVPSFYLIP